MLPPDVIQAVDEMEAMTAGNKKSVLSLCYCHVQNWDSG